MLNDSLQKNVENGKPGINIEIKELVLQKHVGTEIQNVEAGGTGINNEIKKD
jgi:hypothetical protein